MEHSELEPIPEEKLGDGQQQSLPPVDNAIKDMMEEMDTKFISEVEKRKAELAKCNEIMERFGDEDDEDTENEIDTVTGAEEPSQINDIKAADFAFVVPLRLVCTYAIYVGKADDFAAGQGPIVLQPYEDRDPLRYQEVLPKAPRSTRPPWGFVVERPEQLRQMLRDINPDIIVNYMDGFCCDGEEIDAPPDGRMEKQLDFGDVDFTPPALELDAPPEGMDAELQHALDLAKSMASTRLWRQLYVLRVAAAAMETNAAVQVNRIVGRGLQALAQRDIEKARNECLQAHMLLLEDVAPEYAKPWQTGIDWPKQDELSPQAMLQLVAAGGSVLASMSGDWPQLAPERFKSAAARLAVAVRMGKAAMQIYRRKVMKDGQA